MKRIALVTAASLFAIAAHAGNPTAVTNSTGNAVYGTEQALSVEKDTSAGFNRAKVKYASGYQFVNDDGAWSRYAKIVGGFALPVAASASLTYDIAKVNTVVCPGGQSIVAWPNVGMADSLNDGCALFNAAKAAAQ